MTSTGVTPHSAQSTVTEPGRDDTSAPSDATMVQYRLLRSKLLDGAFPPGTVLLETALSTSHGVSRTPVRDALGRLEQDGFLERTKRGYRVRITTAEDILEIYEIRIALEGAAATGAAHQRTHLDLARLRHLASQPQNPSPIDAAKLNSLFHEAIWHASHNNALAVLLDKTVAQIRLFDRAPMAGVTNLHDTSSEHVEIVRAIEDRDGEAARIAVSSHLARTRDVRLAALAQQAHDL